MTKEEIVKTLSSIIDDCLYWGDASQYEKQNGSWKIVDAEGQMPKILNRKDFELAQRVHDLYNSAIQTAGEGLK